MRGIKITFRVRQFVRISIGGIYTAVGKKWTNLDDLSPVLLATFNRFDVYETRKMFSSHRRFFSNA